MKQSNLVNINTPNYWDSHQTAMDFGLRQQKYLEMAGQGGAICELGCGLSPFLSEAKKKFTLAFGVDFSPHTINEARRLFPKVDYVLSDVIKTPLPDKMFDVVVAGEVIEHMEDPKKLVDEMVRLAKHKLVLSTPMLEFNDLEHLWEFTEDSLKDLLAPYGQVTTEVVSSSRFIGRKYIFACVEL